jgi:hypothetical protein
VSGFAERPAGVLFDIAAANARAEFTPDRMPLIFSGAENARMAQAAVCGVPELTARFEAGWPVFVERIHGIGREGARLRVVHGGLAA